MPTIKLRDYDCIGFDLDHTLLQYDVTNIVKLVYGLLADFLIEKKNYSAKYLSRSLNDTDFDFLQKGLILDIERGNILKIDATGLIWRATHGTKLLSSQELRAVYPNQRWQVCDEFAKDMFSFWNGELSLKIRSLLDYFHLSDALIFAKMVDSIDEEKGKQDVYDIWPDILEALEFVYAIEKFQSNGEYFLPLKTNPEKFFHKCSPETIAWIRELKKEKKTFLITGSYNDYADFTASYALGDDWRSLFDVVITFARKPGFFAFDNPFLRIEDEEPVAVEQLQEGGIYSEGNWKGLLQFFTRITGKEDPRCLYLGDNLIQDVYAPNSIANCDTMVVADEQLAEKMLHHEFSHTDEEIINSEFWGSYFSLKEPDGFKDSFWNHIIRTHSKVCIPSVNIISSIDLDQPIECFDKNDENSNGYFPAKPLSLHV